MRKFARVHFTLLRVASLIMAILNFIAVGFIFIMSITAMMGMVNVIIRFFHWLPGFTTEVVLLFIFGCGLPILFACLLLKASKIYGKASKMDDDYLKENRGKIFGWGIFLSIVFAPTIILFIAMLVCVILVNGYIEDLISGKAYEDNRTFGQKVKEDSINIATSTREVFEDAKHNSQLNELDNMAETLKKLNEMKENGLISEEEYQAKRKKILDL